MKNVKKLVFISILLLLTLSSVFAKGGKEVKSDEKLIKVESVQSDEYGYSINGFFEDGEEVIVRVSEETKVGAPVTSLSKGNIIAVKDTGIMTMSLPPQIVATEIRNVTGLVNMGEIKASFAPSSQYSAIADDDLKFATIKDGDLISEFNYCYGYFIMTNLMANGIFVNGGYFARGINDAYLLLQGGHDNILLFSMEEMNDYINQYVEEYLSVGNLGPIGSVYTTMDEVNKLEKPESLPLQFAYSYGVYTTLDLMSYGYDIVAPDYIQGLLTKLYGFFPIYSEEEMELILNEYIDTKNEEYTRLMAEEAANNEIIASNFLEEQKKVPGVIELPSGVLMEIITQDADLGGTPTADDSVIVNYTLRLIDGTIADQGDNVTFFLGALIPGFTEAVTNMKVGQTAMVYIPPKEGYGPNPTGIIPPNSLLIFDIDLIGIVEEEQN